MNKVYEYTIHYMNDLYYTDKTRNEKIVNNINDALIELRNAINRKEIPKNKNPEKVIDIVEEILNFNQQQRGKGLPLNLGKVFAVQVSKY